MKTKLESEIASFTQVQTPTPGWDVVSAGFLGLFLAFIILGYYAVKERQDKKCTK